MTTVVVSQPMLFPWSGMYEHIAPADVYIHRDDVDFSKSFRTHRIQIKTTSGPTWMTIPIAHDCYERPIIELKASHDEWRIKHIRHLKEAYALAPFKKTMIELVEEVYSDQDSSLSDLISQSVVRLAHELQLMANSKIYRASQMTLASGRNEALIDMIKQVDGDIYLTGHGAKNYMDHELFEQNGIEVRYVEYSLSEYPQLHGTFTPYVSALDLIANTGPDAPGYLTTKSVNWREFMAILEDKAI